MIALLLPKGGYLLSVIDLDHEIASSPDFIGILAMTGHFIN
jgi:hypothetical protein